MIWERYSFIIYQKNAIGFKLLQYTHGAIQNVCYEWTDDIEVIVNPSDPELRKYFEQEWSFKDMEQFLPKRSLAWELLDASKGILIHHLVRN